MKIASSVHVVYTNCFLFLFWHSEQLTYKTCTELAIFMYWTCNLMNNLSSYSGNSWCKNKCFWQRFTCNRNKTYRLIVGTLFHIFAMSAIKWHVRCVDCSLIYTDFQRLFVFKKFEFGANFGPRWFSLGSEFETIYGKNCKKMNKSNEKSVVIFWLSWRNNELIWKLLTCNRATYFLFYF